MYENSKTTFKNEVSRRFHAFYAQKFEQGTLTREGVAADFEFGKSYKFGFWKLLAEGKISVNTEQITVAKEKHQLNPGWLWGMSEYKELPDPGLQMPAGYIEEAGDEEYGKIPVSYTSEVVGKVIDEILDKHKVKRTEYAERRLNMTPRNLQRIIAGDINPPFVTVAKIAEDFGEPLDAFRQKPLPKGHFLQLLREREQRIAEQSETIAALQKAVFKLTAA